VSNGKKYEAKTPLWYKRAAAVSKSRKEGGAAVGGTLGRARGGGTGARVPVHVQPPVLALARAAAGHGPEGVLSERPRASCWARACRGSSGASASAPRTEARQPRGVPLVTRSWHVHEKEDSMSNPFFITHACEDIRATPDMERMQCSSCVLSERNVLNGVHVTISKNSMW
jgi:hypothetical protein